MMYQNCKLGAVQSQTDGWGFNILNERNMPLITLTYPTKSEAEIAHGLTAKAITGAAVTPHAA